MSNQPFSFKLPIQRFDLNLLPPSGRQIGTDAFKQAVIAHFVDQYAGKGGTTIVSVDDEEINVLTFEGDSDPLNFILEMLQSGRIKEAIPFLESMTKSDPENVQVLYNLGIAYSETGQFDEAIIRLKKVVQIEPQHAHAWTGIGVAYQRMGKPEQALEPTKKAVAADPSDGYAQRNLGALLLGLGQVNEALAHLRAARSALPHDPQTTFGLAAALEESASAENLAEADELYQVVVQRWPASNVAEQARQARTKLAHRSMRSNAVAGLRPDVVMYITDAFKTLAEAGAAKAQQIALEIALKGQGGLNINDPETKYTLKTLPGEFSGLQLVSIMYTAFKQIDPTVDAGIDLDAEYKVAIAMQAK